MTKLLSTAYFPPISYFAAIAQGMGGIIEYCENYQKQSYRNRCRILAAGGVESLSFPIIHTENGHKQPVSEVRIDYRTPWLQQHKRAIISAYHRSPYFEYYQDELFSILDSRPEKLIDLNMALLRFFLEKTGLAVHIETTTTYEQKVSDPECEDLREIIHPKRPDNILKRLELDKPYFQVFSSKHGFQENLSIMDLLFNEGPESIMYLKKF